MLYTPPTGSTDPNASFVGKNVAAGTLGSKLPPGAAEYPQREIVNLITLAGLNPTNSDLAQLTRAIRGGQLDFDATDTGTADAAVCQVGLAHAKVIAGLPFTFLKCGTANSGAPFTLTITDPNGNNPISGTVLKNNGKSGPAGGDLPANALITVRADTSGNFRLVSLLTIGDVIGLIGQQTRVNLTANTTFYVRPDGNDKNSGLSDDPAHAFATPIGALTAIGQKYNLAGYFAMVQMSKIYATQVLGSPQPVTYPGGYFSNSGVTGQIVLQGDTANPQNYILSPVQIGDGTYSCFGANVNQVTLLGIKLDAGSIASGSCLRVGSGGAVFYGSCILNYSGSSTGFSFVIEDAGGTAGYVGNVTYQGNGGTVGAAITINAGANHGGGATTTVNTVTCNNFALQAGFFSSAAGNASLAQTAFAGSGVTGPRYNFQGGYLNLAGAAETAIPGSTAGTKSLGGRVIGGAGADWTSYTLTVSPGGGSIASYTATGEWRQVDKTLFFSFQVALGTCTNPSGALSVSNPPILPSFPGAVFGRENGVTSKGIAGQIVAGSNIMALNLADGNTAIGTGYILNVEGFYAIAN